MVTGSERRGGSSNATRAALQLRSAPLSRRDQSSRREGCDILACSGSPEEKKKQTLVSSRTEKTSVSKRISLALGNLARKLSPLASGAHPERKERERDLGRGSEGRGKFRAEFAGLVLAGE